MGMAIKKPPPKAISEGYQRAGRRRADPLTPKQLRNRVGCGGDDVNGCCAEICGQRAMRSVLMRRCSVRGICL